MNHDYTAASIFCYFQGKNNRGWSLSQFTISITIFKSYSYWCINTPLALHLPIIYFYIMKCMELTEDCYLLLYFSLLPGYTGIKDGLISQSLDWLNPGYSVQEMVEEEDGIWCLIHAGGMQCKSFYQRQTFSRHLVSCGCFIAKVDFSGTCFPALIITAASYRRTFPQSMACYGSFLPYFWQSLARANTDYYYPAYCSAWLHSEYRKMQVGLTHLAQFMFSSRPHFPFRDVVVVLKIPQRSCVMLSVALI